MRLTRTTLYAAVLAIVPGVLLAQVPINCPAPPQGAPSCGNPEFTSCGITIDGVAHSRRFDSRLARLQRPKHVRRHSAGQRPCV